jgi:hypothetical protein
MSPIGIGCVALLCVATAGKTKDWSYLVGWAVCMLL